MSEVSKTVTTTKVRLKHSTYTKDKRNVIKAVGGSYRGLTKRNSSKADRKKKITLNNKGNKGNEITKHLHNIRTILLHSNATPIKSYCDVGYECGFCKLHNPNPADLKTHILEKHDDTEKLTFMEGSTMLAYVVKLDVTSLKCCVCSNNIDGLEQLMEHLNTHDKRIYTDIKNHILPFKFNNQVPSCAVCSKTFETFKTLHEHMPAHYRNYICDICDAGFITKRNLQAHNGRHKRVEIVMKDTNKISKLSRSRDVSELNKHRFNIRVILKNSNATPIRRHGGIGYTCCFCAEQFPVPADLKRHTIDGHGDDVKSTFMEKELMYAYIVKLDITSLICNICANAINTLEELENHLMNVHNKEYYTDIKSQVMPFKFDDDDLRCVTCGKTFTRFKLLQEHCNGHYRNYICDGCGAGFINRRTLAVHYDAHKTGTFKCEYCPKVFDTYQRKKKHEYCVHIQMQLLSKCGYCNERFKDGRVKDKHLEQVHGVQFKIIHCDSCTKTFSDKSALRTHVRRDHLLERPHECTECDMRFYKRQQLKHHMLTHTGQRRYQCEVCHNSYGKRSTLKEHMRIHLSDSNTLPE